MTSRQIDKYLYFTTRIFYPNWVSLSFFTEGWDFFFKQDVYNLSVWFALIFLQQVYLAEFSIVNLVFRMGAILVLRKVLAGGICTSARRLHGKTVIVTGANSGVGKETARDLLRRGARVILACRTPSKAEDARRELAREGGTVETRQLDLSSLQSVRDFADGIKKDNIRVHILINNAGIACPYEETKEGFEMQMGTNHLGHFLLTNLLLPQLKHDEPARIINLSSIAHCLGEMNFDDFFMKKNYETVQAYGNTKLANALFTRHLAKRLKGTNIQVFAVHPGAVASNFLHRSLNSVVHNYVFPIFLKTPMQGAQTSIYCALEATQDPEMYFTDCAVGWPIPLAKNDLVAEKLWDVSVKLTKLKE